MIWALLESAVQKSTEQESYLSIGLGVCCGIFMLVFNLILARLAVRSYKRKWQLGPDEWLQDYDHQEDWEQEELQAAEARTHPDATEWIEEKPSDE